MSLRSDSRYANDERCTKWKYDDNGEAFVGLRLVLQLAAAADDRYVKPRAGERLEALAYRLWGATFGDDAALLWWVIADLNAIINPFRPLDPSVTLRVPSATRLSLEVFE